MPMWKTHLCAGPILALALASALPGQSLLPPPPAIPPAPAAAPPHFGGPIVLPTAPVSPPLIVHVSPNGSDDGDGSADHPFATPARAQAAVRTLNRDHDVTVRLADGVYRLSAPLRFGAADGGRGGHVVRWQAAEGAHPVLSGGIPVSGWRRADAARDIWVATIPRGLAPRQIWVNDRLAKRAAVEAPRAAFAFHEWGIEIVDPAWRFLATLEDQHRIEVENSGWFTHRHAVVDRIEGSRIVMQQPGWQNNIIGYDTFAKPISGNDARFFLVNSLAFLREGGSYYLDTVKGNLFYKPRAGEDMAKVSVIAPRLPLLMAIGGTHDLPVQDMEFSGIAFHHTSWTVPSGENGYASQQSGSYITGRVADLPEQMIRDCSWGCRAFEAMRNRWHQQPAAVQVAAAKRIRFADDDFSHLGQIALGIGNNDDANESGIGLGASTITVERSRFTDLAGGGMMVGGVRPDAHHPSRPEMGVRDILIRNNLVRSVSQDYREQAAILVTYATGAVITHNEIADAPYDGIDVGWGWGVNDPGGSAAYRTLGRGYYDSPANPVYDTPTILRDTVVFANKVHDVKRWFPDGGAIYHLSADPGALIAENYVYDVPGGIALYLDEGSRYITLRNNVVSNVGTWLNLNSQDFLAPRRTAFDNVARDNWYDSGRRSGSWTEYLNNQAIGNVKIDKGRWPTAAREVIERAGIEPANR